MSLAGRHRLRYVQVYSGDAVSSPLRCENGVLPDRAPGRVNGYCVDRNASMCWIDEMPAAKTSSQRAECMFSTVWDYALTVWPSEGIDAGVVEVRCMEMKGTNPSPCE